MRAEADIGGLEAETFREFRVGRRRSGRLRQARQVKIGRQRLASAMPRDAHDVADLFFQDQAQVLRRQQLRRAQMREQRRRADRGMPGEGQFAARGEDAQRRRIHGVARRDDEHRFGKIELARDLLHARVVEAVGVEHHRERVAGERRIGEDVERVVVSAHGGSSAVRF